MCLLSQHALSRVTGGYAIEEYDVNTLQRPLEEPLTLSTYDEPDKPVLERLMSKPVSANCS